MANITVKSVLWASDLALAMAVGTAFAQDAPAPPQAPATMQTVDAADVDAPARLVVYRINAYPTLRTPKVMVNDRLMFRPKQRTYAEMALPPGRHDIVVNWSGDTGWPDLAFVIDIASGETKYLQISGSYTRGQTTGIATFEYEAGSMAYRKTRVRVDFPCDATESAVTRKAENRGQTRLSTRKTGKTGVRLDFPRDATESVASRRVG